MVGEEGRIGATVGRTCGLCCSEGIHRCMNMMVDGGDDDYNGNDDGNGSGDGWWRWLAGMTMVIMVVIDDDGDGD